MARPAEAGIWQGLQTAAQDCLLELVRLRLPVSRLADTSFRIAVDGTMTAGHYCLSAVLLLLQAPCLSTVQGNHLLMMSNACNLCLVTVVQVLLLANSVCARPKPTV